MAQSKKTALIILDGWGMAKDKAVSAIDQAHTPFVDSLYQQYPHNYLQASGLAVGLPEGQMGNSEVGHMNLGAGRVVYQDLVKINMAVQENTLAQEPVLQEAFAYAKQKGVKLHLMGLLSDGGVHAHIEHLKGLLSAAADEDLKKVYVHAFTDGRDTDPHGALHYLPELEAHMDKSTGTLASVIGRYYAMDRDQRWERIKLAYDLLVKGEGAEFESGLAGLKAAYNKGESDEFIRPIKVKTAEDSRIAPGDVVLCFNFRTDRGRQITMALTQRNFEEQDMKALDLHYVTMTRYDESFKDLKVIYEKANLTDTLGATLAKYHRSQVRIAETEKYPHVTFFFSGGQEQAFEGEERILIPSPKVATYDLQPEMSAYAVRDAILEHMEEQQPDFICLNFANPDMVGHTGVMEAAIKACETVDQCTEAVVKKGLEHDYHFIILADHGNADCMRNADGSPNTAHTTQPVPCFLVGPDSKRYQLKEGKLGDVAPTLLALMEVAQPEAMTGNSLLA